MTEHTGGTTIIVGAGMAGARAAITLRKEGLEGRLVLIGAEAAVPYERPPLSKAYLRGEQTADAIAIRPKDADWDGIEVELRTGTLVRSVDPGARTIDLGHGERLSYDRLLLATGSEPRRLTIPGADLDGVMLLRTLEDADRIRSAVSAGHPVAVIGGGWIGGEVAACLRQVGADVTLITGAAGLLERQLGPELSATYAGLHRRHGVDLRERAETVAIEGTDGRVRGVRLADGGVVPAAVVVAGIGAVPRLGLARDAGLDVGRGVLVDPLFQTSAPGIWAVGDIAEAWHPTFQRRVLLDHWAAAWFGGPAAAKSVLGAGAPYDRVPYLYSDQFDLSMEAWGVPPRWDRVIIRPGEADGAFIAFWLDEGRVVGAMLGNEPGARKVLEPLVRAGSTVDPARAADPAVPLADLLG